MARRVDLVCFVYLVDLVHLVRFVQPNKRDKPNNGLLTLADFINSLLATHYVVVEEEVELSEV